MKVVLNSDHDRTLFEVRSPSHLWHTARRSSTTSDVQCVSHIYKSSTCSTSIPIHLIRSIALAQHNFDVEIIKVSYQWVIALLFACVNDLCESRLLFKQRLEILQAWGGQAYFGIDRIHLNSQFICTFAT